MANIEEFYGVQDEDVLQAILWQYDSATNLQSLVQQKYHWLRNVNDIFWCWYFFGYFYLGSSTQQEGVTIWSILLDYPISASLPPNTDEVWGFGPDDVNFDNGGFGSNDHSVVSLPLEYAILALQLRYFQLTTSGTVTQINAFMNYLFNYTPGVSDINAPHILVIDNHDMTMTYKLNFTPDQFLRFIMDNLDLLPRPAGVGVNWTTVLPDAWGFGPDDFNFDNGIFGA